MGGEVEGDGGINNDSTARLHRKKQQKKEKEKELNYMHVF